jgi:hypothetical protein
MRSWGNEFIEQLADSLAARLHPKRMDIQQQGGDLANLSDQFIAKLADALAKHISPPIPISIDLWNIELIGKYLKRDAQSVRERIACLPDFPEPIRLPSTKGRSHGLYRAAEVIAWTEGLRKKVPGRPRKHIPKPGKGLSTLGE